MLRIVLSPRWLARHVFVVLVVLVCLGFGRWQLGRAEDRHSLLNWSYTIEWSLFAAFAVLVWGWYLVDEIRGGERTTREVPTPALPASFSVAVPAPVTEEEDPELAAYNRYLASLNNKDRA